MKLPDKFMFYTESHKDLIYTAERVDIGEYMISWPSYPPHSRHGGSEIYDEGIITNAVRRKRWIMVNIDTNEHALALLMDDDKEGPL